MLNKKLSAYLLIAFLLLLPVLTSCSTATIFDNNNVTQCALQSDLAEDITKSYAIQIAGNFLQHVYSDQRFIEKQIELTVDGFTFKYALQQNGPGKRYFVLKANWQDLSSIVAENYSSHFFKLRATRKYFKVQFEGRKTIKSVPVDDQSIKIKKNTTLLFEKNVTHFRHSRRDIALALLILSGQLSETDAYKASQQADKNRAESKDKNTYKIVFIIFLLVLLFLVLKFKNIAATRSKRYCSTCKKAFDKNLDDCPTCGERATEIITPDGWTRHIRGDTLPGVTYAYILAAIIIFAIIVFLLLLIEGI